MHQGSKARQASVGGMTRQSTTTLPQDLAQDIRQFGMKGYANKYFQVKHIVFFPGEGKGHSDPLGRGSIFSPTEGAEW